MNKLTFRHVGDRISDINDVRAWIEAGGIVSASVRGDITVPSQIIIKKGNREVAYFYWQQFHDGDKWDYRWEPTDGVMFFRGATSFRIDLDPDPFSLHQYPPGMVLFGSNLHIALKGSQQARNYRQPTIVGRFDSVFQTRRHYGGPPECIPVWEPTDIVPGSLWYIGENWIL